MDDDHFDSVFYDVLQEELAEAHRRGMIHRIVLRGQTFEQVLLAGKWLVENYGCENGRGYQYIHDMQSPDRHWLFTDHRVAMAFKLRWG